MVSFSNTIINEVAMMIHSLYAQVAYRAVVRGMITSFGSKSRAFCTFLVLFLV